MPHGLGFRVQGFGFTVLGLLGTQVIFCRGTLATEGSPATGGRTEEAAFASGGRRGKEAKGRAA